LATVSNSGDSTASRTQTLFSQIPIQKLLSSNFVSARTTQNLLHSNGSCVCFAGKCLPSRCPETALVYPPISRSLHSNGSRCYNTMIQSTPTYTKWSLLSGIPTKYVHKFIFLIRATCPAYVTLPDLITKCTNYEDLHHEISTRFFLFRPPRIRIPYIPS
jgi:hypothetical protein